MSIKFVVTFSSHFCKFVITYKRAVLVSIETCLIVDKK